jgi:hypothetical protein
VLVFYRGDWCPHYNLALHQYQSELVVTNTVWPDRRLSSPQKPESL